MVHSYHLEEGEKALQQAKEALNASGLAYSAHVLVGEVATVIAQSAASHHCTLIAMGTRGLGSLTGLFIGSITTKVLQHSQCPVLLAP